jgi:formyl-CoA transferase
VYCSITGFGQTGPYAERAGYDFIIQGMGGFMSVTGERDDAPGGGPQKAGIAVADLMTGMYATTAVLAAIAHRERAGIGQYIDTSLFDTQIAMMATLDMNYLVSGTPPGRAGNAHQSIVPYQVFPCADGHLILAIGNDGQFARFCDVAGKPEWRVDSRFATNAGRVQQREILVPMIAAVMLERPQRDWLSALEAAGVPCGPINRLDQVFADPQAKARGMRIDLPHPLSGSVPQVANPLNFSATPLTYTQAPPLLGQHTESVLAGRLGLSKQSLADLVARGVIQVNRRTVE